MTEEEIIKKLKINSSDKVLDIGGAMRQKEIIQVHTLVDLLKPEEAPYGRSKLKAQNFKKVDITKEILPFANKEFDVCLCTQTLEDLYNPFLVLEEMQRVAKRGYIETPSFGADIVFSHVDVTDWLTGFRRTPGNAHHKWLFQKENGVLKIIPKNYPILYSPEFQVTNWKGERHMEFIWKDKLIYKEIVMLDFHSLISEYRKFFKTRKKEIVKGRALIFIDNPYYFLKQIAKFVLKKGSGFRKRNEESN